MVSNEALDMSQGVGVEQYLPIGAVVEDRNRNAPGALAGDAPVSALFHHRFDPVST